MPQNGSGRLLFIFSKSVHGKHLQASHSISQSKNHVSSLTFIIDHFVSGHNVQPDQGTAGLHVPRPGLGPGGGAPGAPEGCGGPEGERSC